MYREALYTRSETMFVNSTARVNKSLETQRKSLGNKDQHLSWLLGLLETVNGEGMDRGRHREGQRCLVNNLLHLCGCACKNQEEYKVGSWRVMENLKRE